MKNRKTVLLSVLFLAAVLGLLVWTTVGVGRYRCEVCITYRGQQSCRTASAVTREEARRTAASNACAQIASGMTESMQCENTAPDRVTWLDR